MLLIAVPVFTIVMVVIVFGIFLHDKQISDQVFFLIVDNRNNFDCTVMKVISQLESKAILFKFSDVTEQYNKVCLK
jgi:hypothetical protein